MMLTIYSWKCSPSHISAIKDTVPLKYNRATDSLNGVKCATVQLHPQWYTDLSGKSPKSGQFCTQGKWTTLAQTDLISVWFTTSNHLMSQCHIHIIHSFVFLSKNYNKSVGKVKTFWSVGFFFSALSSLTEHNGHEMGDRERAKRNLILLLLPCNWTCSPILWCLIYAHGFWHLITSSYLCLESLK